jgi:hypothetical protein
VSKAAKTVTVRARVTPSRRGRVAVALFRRQNGTFVRVASKAGALTTTGVFTASFRRPRAGMCKATARYGGASGQKPSQASATFRC